MNLSICSFQKPETLTLSDHNFSVIETVKFTDLKFAENIAKEFHTILQRFDTTVENLETISIVNGPGSYTGLRCGFGFLKGLVQGLDMKYGKRVGVFGVDYFDLVNHRISKENLSKNGNCLVLQDARNSRYFCKKDNKIVIIDLVQLSEFTNNNIEIFGSNLSAIEPFSYTNISVDSELLNDYVYKYRNELVNYNSSEDTLLNFLPTYVLEPRIG